MRAWLERLSRMQLKDSLSDASAFACQHRRISTNSVHWSTGITVHTMQHSHWQLDQHGVPGGRWTWQHVKTQCLPAAAHSRQQPPEHAGPAPPPRWPPGRESALAAPAPCPAQQRQAVCGHDPRVMSTAAAARALLAASDWRSRRPATMHRFQQHQWSTTRPGHAAASSCQL